MEGWAPPPSRPLRACFAVLLVVLALFATRRAHAAESPRGIDEATTQRVFRRLAALRASDGCRLDGVRTESTRMEVRWQVPNAGLEVVHLEYTRDDGGDAPADALVVRSTPGFERACPATLTALKEALATEVVPAPSAQAHLRPSRAAPRPTSVPSALTAKESATAPYAAAFLAVALAAALVGATSGVALREVLPQLRRVAREHRVGFALGAVVVLAAAMRFAIVSVRVPALYNDWDWFASFDEGLPGFARRTVSYTSVRVTTRALFAGSRALFGPVALPLATLLTAVNLYGAVLAARLFERLGLAWPVAIGASLVAFSGEGNLESLTFLAANEAQLGRCLVVATLFVFLADGAPRRALWVPLVLLGFATNEVYVATPLLLLLCVWFRDGTTGARRLARERSTREAAGLFALLFGLHVLHHARLGGSVGNHALATGAVSANLERFVRASAAMLKAPLAALAAAVLVAKVAQRIRPDQETTTPPGRALRVAGAALAMAGIGFAPYAAFAGYWNPYFVGLGSLGVGLLAFGVLGPYLSATRAAPLLWPLVLGVAAAPLRRADLRYDEVRAAEAFRAEAARAIAERPGGGLYFLVGDPPGPHDVGLRLEPIVAADAGTRSRMLDVLAPDHPFELVRLTQEEASFACARPGDAALATTTASRFVPCRGVPPAVAALSPTTPRDVVALGCLRSFWSAFVDEDGPGVEAALACLADARVPSSLSPRIDLALATAERVFAALHVTPS